MATKYKNNYIEFIKIDDEDIGWVHRELEYWYNFLGIYDLKVKFYEDDKIIMGVIVNDKSIDFIEHVLNYKRCKKINKILQ